MEVERVLHMNSGSGESSYANNSNLQRTVILEVQPVLDDTIKEMFSSAGFPKCFTIADLGCSSGPNALLIISNILETIHGLCINHNNCKVPEFQVYLNDLPENDFSSIFKLLPSFYDKLKKEKGEEFGPCFISGVPGSFYGRLFATRSLHFVHSSYSVHWLSQVPEGLEENKGNIYMAKTSPPHVFEVYLKQFQKDFSKFLQMRSEEIIAGGCMVLTFMGRSIEDPTSKDGCYVWELLTKSLLHMVAEGLVEEADINSFNIPLYTPYKDEVEAIIEREGSFTLERLETIEDNWDSRDNGRFFSKTIRAVIEPMLASHFGNTIMDNLFEKYAKLVGDHLAVEMTKCFNVVVALKKI